MHFSNPFQSQEDKGLVGAFKKEPPLARYLPLRALTQKKRLINSHLPTRCSQQGIIKKLYKANPKPTQSLGLANTLPRKKWEIMFLILGKTLPKFSQTWIDVSTKRLQQEKKRRNINGNGISNWFQQSSPSSLWKKSSFSSWDLSKNPIFKFIKSIFLLTVHERGIPRYLALARIGAWWSTPLIEVLEAGRQFLLKNTTELAKLIHW